MQTPVRLSFEEYLSLDAEALQDLLPEGRHEFVDGELVEVPPESEPNRSIALKLQLALIQQLGILYRLVRPGDCDIAVPPLPNKKAKRTRFPDLVLLRPEHLEMMQKQLTIKPEMPPPELVVEVVSPGKSNRDRDYREKMVQYAQRGIPEYWIVDREEQCVYVMSLVEDVYEPQRFTGGDRVISPVLPALELTATEVLEV